MHEVGAVVDSAKSDVSESKQEKAIAEHKAEEWQNPVKPSKAPEIKAKDSDGVEVEDENILPWSSRVEQGLSLPTKDDKIEFYSFKKAWREWYKQSINIDAQPETRFINKKRFEAGKKHMEKLGYEVVPNEENGRVKLMKRDLNFYNFVGDRIPPEKVRESVGVTTGWTEIDSDV